MWTGDGDRTRPCLHPLTRVRVLGPPWRWRLKRRDGRVIGGWFWPLAFCTRCRSAVEAGAVCRWCGEGRSRRLVAVHEWAAAVVCRRCLRARHEEIPDERMLVPPEPDHWTRDDCASAYWPAWVGEAMAAGELELARVEQEMRSAGLIRVAGAGDAALAEQGSVGGATPWPRLR